VIWPGDRAHSSYHRTSLPPLDYEHVAASTIDWEFYRSSRHDVPWSLIEQRMQLQSDDRVVAFSASQGTAALASSISTPGMGMAGLHKKLTPDGTLGVRWFANGTSVVSDQVLDLWALMSCVKISQVAKQQGLLQPTHNSLLLMTSSSPRALFADLISK
jgi:hypothetical protein